MDKEENPMESLLSGIGELGKLNKKRDAAKAEGKYFRPLQVDELIDWGLSNSPIKDLKIGDHLKVKPEFKSKDRLTENGFPYIFTVHRLISEPAIDSDGGLILMGDFTVIAYNGLGEPMEYPAYSGYFIRA